MKKSRESDIIKGAKHGLQRLRGKEYDPFLRHEALDRCHVIMSMIDEHLHEHPALTKAQNKSVKRIIGALWLLYQELGEGNI